MVVTDFLIAHFKEVMDYGFTADVEKEFDEIARGEKKWNQMINNFMVPFMKRQKRLQTSERARGERLLGEEPGSGENVYVKIGRFGPMAQIGEASDESQDLLHCLPIKAYKPSLEETRAACFLGWWVCMKKRG